MVDAAHAQSLYVIFDSVLNHTGDVFAYQCDPGDRVCQDTPESEASHRDHPQPVRWRDKTGVPRPEFPVIEDIPNPPREALVWPLECQRNRFLRREGNPQENFFTFGEVFDSRAEEDIARFIGRNTNDGSELVGVDAALDYPLFDALKAAVKGFGAPVAVAEVYRRRKAIEKRVHCMSFA